ncbi:MAG TPA: aldo/keto reductase [Gammaproteobacteria bacterium]|nr:aldo/keto reductase [Gammaproteobacteria bacterium]
MITRRELLLATASTLAAGSLAPWSGAIAGSRSLLRKPIPSSGEYLPVIGMGTWQTFHVDDDADERAPLREVLRVFFDRGGTLIDSSPMYAQAEEVAGELVAELGEHERLFAATKVWTDGRDEGIEQMERSFRRMRVERMDLMQIHNLRDWRAHLPTLREWQQHGRVRYIGITTSNTAQYEAFAALMRSETLDFVQFNYNIGMRSAEQELLPLAAERGMAVLVNRPFGGGDLFPRVRGQKLPAWAAEFDCESWAQFFLKFVVSHPAVTCAIPATSNPRHAADNMGAGFGRLPDARMRARMARYVDEL